MKKLVHIVLIISLFLSFSSFVFSQEKEDIHIVFIKDMGAKDYYTLLNSKEEVLKFKLIEACIPKGLIAIEYVKGYDEDDLRSYIQSVILKLTDKLASPTSYSIDDLRQACSEYREGLNE